MGLKNLKLAGVCKSSGQKLIGRSMATTSLSLVMVCVLKALKFYRKTSS